jgi:hypothetical protein
MNSILTMLRVVRHGVLFVVFGLWISSVQAGESWKEPAKANFILWLDSISIYLSSFIISLSSFAIGYLVFGGRWNFLKPKPGEKDGRYDFGMVLCALQTWITVSIFCDSAWSFFFYTIAMLISTGIVEFIYFRISPVMYVQSLLEEGGKPIRRALGWSTILFSGFYRIASIEFSTQEGLSLGVLMWVVSSIGFGMFFTRVLSRVSNL